MKLARQLPLLLLLLLGYGIANGQNAMQVRKLKKELAKISGSKEFKTATIGFCLMDVETGKILVEENAEKSLIPASTMKLITTGAGLALLGDTFRFKTELGYTGSISKDVLKGDIVITGYFDPTFGSSRWEETKPDKIFNTFNSTINAYGIKEIHGRVYAESNDLFGKYIPGDFNISDVFERYGVPPYQLNFRENYWETTDTIRVNDIIDSNITRVLVVGNYAPYNSDGVSNTNTPPALFADVYSLAIGTDNHDYNPIIKSTSIANKVNITTYYSPVLSDITTKTNAQSINLYAECILRGIGIQKYGPSTLDTSIAAVKSFWKNEVGDLQGLRMTDGSGLSRSNLCTPQLFCKMLTAYTKRDNFASFYSTLPVAGKDGTVKNFAKGTAADGNAHIKSGSMSRVKCYAGYVTGKNGKLYAVSIMLNNFEPDATVTAACTTLIGKVAELKGGKAKKTFVVNRGN
jgi:D-alanyl-D-alanine carboxypeptidase/D-alanyl-D-alanine-endopeptidase (penicillin-binding protein 4)